MIVSRHSDLAAFHHFVGGIFHQIFVEAIERPAEAGADFASNGFLSFPVHSGSKDMLAFDGC